MTAPSRRSGRRVRQAGGPIGLALIGVTLIAAAAHAKSPARAPAMPPLPLDRRPVFALPPLDAPSLIGPDGLDVELLAATGATDSSRLSGGPASRWTHQLPPLFPEPVRAQPERGRWWLGLGTGPSGSAGLDRALRDALRLRAEGDAWGERIPERNHWRIDAQLSAREAAHVPDWRGWVDLALLREGWDAYPAAHRAHPGAMRATVVTGGLQRAVSTSLTRFVFGLDAAGAQVRTHACPLGTCAAGAEVARTGRWRSIGVGVRTAGTARDLRRYAGSAMAGSALGDLELWGGVAHRRSPEGMGQSVGRWRARAVWGLPRDTWHLAAGWAALGEGEQTCIGPILGLRRVWVASRTCAALELAPDLRSAEAVVALPERLPEVALIREVTPPPIGLRTPVVYDPRLAPQRAWPALTGEVLRENDAGWWDLALSIARLRGALDWRPDSLAEGTQLLRAVTATSRVVARVTFTAERRLRSDLVLTARYRGIRDARAGDPQRALHALPEHRLQVRLERAGPRWRWGLRTEARGRAPAASGTRALPATLVVTAHVGLAWGASELRLVGENLGDAAVCDEPYAPVLRRWVGLEWNLLDRASVP